LRRILHLSDLHFGPPLVPSTVAGVFDLVERTRPDLVVLAGGLTESARRWQFQQAQEFAASLELLAPVLAVPGDRDVPRGRFWERIFDPFGSFRRDFLPELEPVFHDDELFVVGLNSAHGFTSSHGRIGRASLRRAVERLQEVAQVDGLCRVAVVHHPLTVPASFHGQRPLRRARQTVRQLESCGVEVVLSGHVHHFHAGALRSFYPELEREILVLHAGTATSNRGEPPESGLNSCVLLEVTGDLICFERLAWRAERRRFESEAEFRFVRSPL
jgi:3',5'-cyclic AMP phosphodiesterase CpdA